MRWATTTESGREDGWSVIGLEINGFAVGLEGLGVFSLASVDVSEAGERLLVVGMELDGVAVSFFGLGEIALFAERVAEVIKEGGTVGRGFEVRIVGEQQRDLAVQIGARVIVPAEFRGLDTIA